MFTLYDGLQIARQDVFGLPLPLFGVVESSTATTFVDTANLNATKFPGLADDVLQDNGYFVWILEGTGVDQVRALSDFVESTGTGTVSAAWDVDPNTTSKYAIVPADTVKSTVDSAAASTFTDAILTEADDYWNGWTVYVFAGTGKGQTRYVSDFVESTDTATISQPWLVVPDTTSQYLMFKGIQPIPIAGVAVVTPNHTGIASERQNPTHVMNKQRQNQYGYNIAIPIKMTADGITSALREFFGDYTFASAAPNTHTHKFASVNADFTQILKRGFTVHGGSPMDGRYAIFDSCCATGFSFTGDVNGALAGAFECFSREESLYTAGLPYYPQMSAIDFDSLQIELKIGTDAGEVIQNARAITFAGTKTIFPDYDRSVNTVLKYTLGAIEVSGTFTIDLEQSTVDAIEVARRANTTQSLVITLESDQIATGAEPYKTIIDLHEVTVDFARPIADENSNRIITYPFTAGLHLGTDLITVTEYNMHPTL